MLLYSPTLQKKDSIIATVATLLTSYTTSYFYIVKHITKSGHYYLEYKYMYVISSNGEKESGSIFSEQFTQICGMRLVDVVLKPDMSL